MKGTEESTMATTASSTTASSGGMTVIIIAIVVVIVIIVAAVAIVIFFVWVRKRRKRKQMLQLTPGFGKYLQYNNFALQNNKTFYAVNVMYTTRKSTAGASNEAVVINDIYEDTNTTDDKFKEDLESTYTYASGTYDVAMGTYDVPTAVTSTSPLFDSSASYAECGPNDKVIRLVQRMHAGMKLYSRVTWAVFTNTCWWGVIWQFMNNCRFVLSQRLMEMLLSNSLTS